MDRMFVLSAVLIALALVAWAAYRIGQRRARGSLAEHIDVVTRIDFGKYTPEQEREIVDVMRRAQRRAQRRGLA